MSIVISTPGGPIRGARTPYGAAFLGVPYAAAPTGVARFAAPAPVAPWTGVRDATQASATSPQPDRSRLGDLELTHFFAPAWRRGDDSLTVSVQTPGVTGRAPVVVYLHGGAFIAGSNGAAAYDGSRFARDGIVYVAVNYRLGVPGFLRLPDAADNRGLLDVLAALRWVQESIASFGGDPDRVTLMGQSAGAILALAVAGRPDAEGLFARVIVQSGTPYGGLSIEQADRVTDAVGRSLGVVSSAVSLYDIPDDELVRASVEAAAVDLLTERHRPPMDGIVRFGVVTDISLLGPLASGPGAARPLLLGSNLDEAALYPDPTQPEHAPLGAEEALIVTAARVADDPAGLLQAYRRENADLSLEALRLLIRSDGMFTRGTRDAADAHAATGPTYLYEFGWRSTALGGRLGASHLMELPFVFDNTDAAALRGETRPLGAGPLPSELASRMHGAWVAFIRDADPGWDAYEPDHRTVQRIDAEWTASAHHRSAALSSWRA